MIGNQNLKRNIVIRYGKYVAPKVLEFFPKMGLAPMAFMRNVPIKHQHE